MPTDNPIIRFMEEVNQKLYDVYKQDILTLEYWTNGVLEGLSIGLHQIWNDEEEEFSKEVIVSKINDYIKSLSKISHIIAHNKFKGA